MRFTPMKVQNIDVEDFDARFDDGESVLPYADMSKASRPNRVKRVNVDFPAWMVEELDREAAHLNVPRQALIKIWLAERLNRASLATA